MGQLLYRKKKNSTKSIGGDSKFLMEKKNSFQLLESTVRGFANHRRIEIMFLLEEKPNQSVADISEYLNINFKTASVHIQRLAVAKLLEKHHDGNIVRHVVTPQGKVVLKFLRILE